MIGGPNGLEMLTHYSALVVGSTGDVMAAVDVSCDTMSVSITALKSVLPKLLATVEEINIVARALGVRFT